MDAYIYIGIVFLVSLFVTIIMVPVSRKLAYKIGAVDYPSNRRVNNKPIPRCGGIALYCGFMAGLAVLYVGMKCFSWTFYNTYFLQTFNYPLLFLGITCMFAVGLVDDMKQLSPGVKLIGQIISSIVVALSGVSIGSVHLFGQGFTQLGFLDIPITVFYLVVFVNITNLIDGLDGLAAGIVAICAVALMILVIRRGSITLGCVCVCLIAVCLGFLRFNFHPASIFMGDSGALFLGLMLGIISLTGVVRMQSIVVLSLPILIAGVPIVDAASAILRRLIKHQPISSPDLDHIHHRLLRRGLNQRLTVLFLYGVTVVMVVLALFLSNVSGMVRFVATVIVFVIGSIIVIMLGVAKPVLQHHYDNLGKTGKRKPHVHNQADDNTSNHPSDEEEA